MSKLAPAVRSWLVSKEELTKLRDLEEDYAMAGQQVSDLEGKLKAARLALLEKVADIQSIEQLKQVDPQMLEEIIQGRLEKGLWKPARGAPAFVFACTSAGRYPAWKQEFTKLLGEAKAAEVSLDTPKTYSYRVEVAEV